MPDSALEPTIEGIISEVGRIRILVVGKTGVGKTSLIKEIFKVDTLEAAHDRVGISDIEQELISPGNNRFVIHDSQGYEPGSKEKYEALLAFIKKRRDEPRLADRLHVIWVCIAVPYASGRVLETGTEDLLRSIPTDIAVVVVFTKYDRLVGAKRRNHRGVEPDELARRCNAEAEADFDKYCIQPLHEFAAKFECRLPQMVKVSVKTPYQPSLWELVEISGGSIELAERHGEESSGRPVSVILQEDFESTSLPLMVMAQRVEPVSKVELAIRVGRKKYWRGLASSAHFPGFGLRACLTVLHKDIVTVWNISDPHNLLLSETFESSISQLVGELDKWSDTARKAMSTGIGTASVLSAVAGAAAGPAAPIVALSVFFGVLFAKWAIDTYTKTAPTVRCLMAYIVHLIKVMQGIFDTTLQGRVVSHDSIDEVVRTYWESPAYRLNSEKISTFVVRTGKIQLADRDYVLEELERLIRS